MAEGTDDQDVLDTTGADAVRPQQDFDTAPLRDALRLAPIPLGGLDHGAAMVAAHQPLARHVAFIPLCVMTT
jgi:hypothetical protein